MKRGGAYLRQTYSTVTYIQSDGSSTKDTARTRYATPPPRFGVTAATAAPQTAGMINYSAHHGRELSFCKEV